MIQQPSQYDCDKMEMGDVVLVRHVSPIYKFIRKYFKKDLNIIKVRDGWEEPVKYNNYYQEDCTLLYKYEIACVQKFENEIPCLFSKQVGTRTLKKRELPLVQVSLYNIQIALDKNHAITLPASYIYRALEENQRILKQCDDNRKVQDAIKFQKYKGSYFKKYVINNNINKWEPLYCSVCGHPLVFKFNSNDIQVENLCECKSLEFNLDKLSYDEFALWYANQVAFPTVLKRYNDFWFNKDD